ncbi:MAG: hypothetical protein Q7K25_07375 [Actinomycetota bacterium]|nr:hypothetical protein [Actinomycetota bacterium]
MSWITTAQGRAARAVAARLLAASPKDPLLAGTALRRELPDLAPDQAAVAIEQAQLSQLAHERYGIQAEQLLLTRDGLEQATRPEVAARRAAFLREQGARRVIDLTSGLGFDVRAFVAAGLEVTAVEKDALTAQYLRMNVPGAQVVHADATQIAASLIQSAGADTVIFLDPARRRGQRTADGSRAQSERDPQLWSPPWSFVTSLALGGRRVCVKLPPGFDPAQVPVGWSGIWTSMNREPVEAMLCSWSLDHARTALALGAFGSQFSSDGGAVTTTAALGQWLVEPDSCLIQAHLLDDFCSAHAPVHRVDQTGTWLSSTALVSHPMLRSYRVLDQLPNDTRALRKALQARDIGELTIKCRGMKINADSLRRELKLTKGQAATIVIARVEGTRSTLLVHEDS